MNNTPIQRHEVRSALLSCVKNDEKLPRLVYNALMQRIARGTGWTEAVRQVTVRLGAGTLESLVRRAIRLEEEKIVDGLGLWKAVVYAIDQVRAADPSLFEDTAERIVGDVADRAVANMLGKIREASK